jgi:uncharacterized protein YbjT (DUF2867 family)
MTAARTALVTGATGYIGGQLVPALLDAGWRVRVLSRRANRITSQNWSEEVEIVEGDATSPEDLRRALEGVTAGYYLIHSMDGGGDFSGRDRELAERFAAAAEDRGVQRLVYLGGMHPAGEPLSPHLASRVEVGQILLSSGVPTAVLQAAVVLGAGSASFDMLRHLTTRLPVMVAPRWLDNRIQPIGIDDVVRCLVAAADLPPDVNRTFDIAGPDVLTYREMILRFAELMGLRRRLVVTVPVLTPRLASHWVGLVTPIPAGLAKPLVASLIHEVVANEHDLEALVPQRGGMATFDEAVCRAMVGLPRDAALRNLAHAGGLAAVAGSLLWFRTRSRRAAPRSR